MVFCWHLNAVVKPIIYFTINCFMEKKYWRNPQNVYVESRRHGSSMMMYLLPIMANDWCIANWIILSYRNWCSWVIFTHSGFVAFLSVLPCGQFRLPFLFTESLKKYLISCLSVTISLNVSQSCFYILHPFSLLPSNLAVGGVQMFLFSSPFIKTPFSEILLLNISAYWQGYITAPMEKNNLIPSGYSIPWMRACERTTEQNGQTRKDIYLYSLWGKHKESVIDTGRSIWQMFL